MLQLSSMRLSLISVAVSAMVLSACSSPAPAPAPRADDKEAARPAMGSLSRTLNMVDKDGKMYGTVELDPLGGGKLYDADGRLIGLIESAHRHHDE